MDFKVESHYSSWPLFFEAFERYKNETHQPFVISSSRTSSAANQRIKDGKRKYPESAELSYAYVEFKCTHSGNFAASGKGIRNHSSFKCGCLAKILASVDKLSSRVFVKIISAEHNHEISQALYKHYPKQRLLNKSEESGLKSLCKLKVSSKMLRHHVKQNIGKNLCLKDISNIKSRVRASDKSQSGVNWNDAQLLLTRVKEMKMMDTGATVDIGTKEDGTLKHLFYQSSDMKAKFNSFPEHILVDATYCVNDRQMPLVTFMCVDGNLESNVVALALVCEESKDMLSLIYRTLRLHNPCTERLNTFMVDKDLNEISCLQTAFPNAIIELCLFHVQKAMKKKINELSCGKIVKDVLRECCAKVCYARSECEYEECKKKLLECDIEFASYFIEHWDSMRDKWVQFERNKHLNFNNRTNNRLESFHQKLKSEVPRNAPLDIMFENILLVLESLKNEISHRQFQAAMKQKPCSRYAYLQNQLTPFAFSHTISELDKMTSLICEVRNDCVVVQDDGERIVQNDTCDCRIFSTFCLPCRHIMASYKIRDMPPLHIGLFSERWMRRNQEVPAHLPGVVHRSLNDNPARRPWTKARKYMEAKVLALKIADKMSEIGMHSFFSYVKELNKLDTKLSFQRLADSGVELNEDTERLEDLSCVDISSVGVDVEPANSGVIDEENVRGRGSVSVLRIEEDTGFEREIVVNCENVNRMDRDDTNNVVVNCDIVNELHESSDGENDTNIILSEEMSGGYSAEYATENNVNNEADNLDGQNVELDNTSGNNVQEGSNAVDYDVLFFREIIANVKPPLGLSKRGRPKGSHLTVLGSERKRKKKNSCNGRSTFKEKVGRNNSSRSFNSVSTMPLCSSRSACIQSESFELSNVKTSTPPPLSSRFEFFKSAQEVLSSCQTFQELSIVAKSLSKSIGVFQLPDVSLRSVGQKNAVDMSAFKLLREATPDFEEPFLPVKVVGDGNCVPRSLSILCFGDQDHHQEIRCRIAIELSANPHDYLNLPKDQLNLLCQFSDCLSSTPMETFQKETLKISKNSEYMGMWQVMAATRVFKTAIRSVYPALGPETCRAFFNRTFYPLETISSLSTFTILWCATEDHEKNMPNEYWTANHVVPLVARG